MLLGSSRYDRSGGSIGDELEVWYGLRHFQIDGSGAGASSDDERAELGWKAGSWYLKMEDFGTGM